MYKHPLLLIFSLLSTYYSFAINTVKDKLILPNDSNIIYQGRIDFSEAKKPNFSYPGISIITSFKGTYISALLFEEGEGDEKHQNYFNILIDNKLHKTIALNPGKNTILLANNLTDTIHQIELFKRTESMVGKCAFGGFLVNALATVSKPNLKYNFKFEFIGDSFTAGYGNDTSYNKGQTTGFHSKHENNFNAWGAIVSRKLNAQYMCTAYSGRGLYRNNTGFLHGTMPLVYDKIIPDEIEGTNWNHQSYKPDLIAINLGANDFYQDANGGELLDTVMFAKTYLEFLKKLHQIQPQAKLICIISSSFSDNWPPNKKQRTRFISMLNDIVTIGKKEISNEIFMCTFNLQKAPYGEDWHASTPSHFKMAEEFELFLKTNILVK